MKSVRLRFLEWESPIKDITCLIFFNTSVSLATIPSSLALVKVKMGVLMDSKIESEKMVVKWRVDL